MKQDFTYSIYIKHKEQVFVSIKSGFLNAYLAIRPFKCMYRAPLYGVTFGKMLLRFRLMMNARYDHSVERSP